MAQMNERQLIEEIIQEVKKRTEKKSRKTILVVGSLSKTDQEILEKEFVLVSPSSDQPFQMILLAELSTELLAELATGLSATKESRVVMQALLEGKKIFYVEKGVSYLGYKERASKALILLFQEYEEAICRYGAERISHPTQICECVACEIHRDYTSRSLIQESDLIRARREGVKKLLLGDHTILTPLALDYAANHEFRIIRKKEKG